MNTFKYHKNIFKCLRHIWPDTDTATEGGYSLKLLSYSSDFQMLSITFWPRLESITKIPSFFFFFYNLRALLPQWLRPAQLGACSMSQEVNNKKKNPAYYIRVSYEVNKAHTRQCKLETHSNLYCFQFLNRGVGKKINWRAQLEQGWKTFRLWMYWGKGLSYHKLFRTWQSAETVNARGSLMSECFERGGCTADIQGTLSLFNRITKTERGNGFPHLMAAVIERT